MNILIDLHTHTVASTHGLSTVDEYIRYSQKKGLVMYGVSDHGPSVTDAPKNMHFWVLPTIPRFVEGVAILRGIEANISKGGKIDADKRIMRCLDYVMAGFHNDAYPINPNVVENTDTLIKAMEKGFVDIITHPGNKNYPLDVKAICEASRSYNVALEINASTDVNSRMGSTACCIELAKECCNVGCPMIIGSDAHVCYSVGSFQKSYEILEACQTEYEHLIINRSVDTLLSFLEDRGHARISEFDEFRKDH